MNNNSGTPNFNISIQFIRITIKIYSINITIFPAGSALINITYTRGGGG